MDYREVVAKISELGEDDFESYREIAKPYFRPSIIEDAPASGGEPKHQNYRRGVGSACYMPIVQRS